MNINTIKKIITLKSGEKFTLPPDSTLLSTTGTLTSTGCPVPTPESYQCYGILFAIGSSSSSSEPLDQLSLKGFKINGQEYLFNSEFVMNDGIDTFTSDLQLKINTNPILKDLFNEVCAVPIDNPGGGRGKQYFIGFKSLPSLVLDGYLITQIRGDVFTAHGPFAAYLPIKSRTKLLADGLPNGACPCS